MGPKPSKPQRFTGKKDGIVRHVRTTKETQRGIVSTVKAVAMPRVVPPAVRVADPPAAQSSQMAGQGADDAHMGGEATEVQSEDNRYVRPTKSKDQNDYLGEFERNRETLLKALLAQYAFPTSNICTGCERLAQWRCRNCHLRPLLCRRCCRNDHIHLPFHRIERWTGTYFEAATLWEIGATLQVPHLDGLCDNLSTRLISLEKTQGIMDLQEQKELARTFITQQEPQGLDTGREAATQDGATPAEVGLEDTSAGPIEAGSATVAVGADDSYAGPMDAGWPMDVDARYPMDDAHDDNDDGMPGLQPVDDSDDEDDTDPTLVGDPGDDDDWESMEPATGQPPAKGIPRDDPDGNPFVTIVDTSGIHHLPLLSCSCTGPNKKVEECLASGLFPASYQEIRTVFTCACLDDFRMANLEAKTSPYQYFHMLRRKTNPGSPASVPDRYIELRRLSREWRNLKKFKLNGFANKRETPTTASLAQFCPTCPQPGVNLPPDWRTAAPPEVYTRQFVADGNFTADHLRQKYPERDIWLLNGEGMMPERRKYDEHLRAAVEKPTTAPCERNFRAVNLANMLSASSDVTGIAAVACARHGCFAPGAVVDLQKGERQMNVDWALCQALRNTRVPNDSKILLIYDIMCQYSIHLNARVHENRVLRDQWPSGVTVDGGIGLFHVHGHRDECLFRYATYYIPGAACVDGEVLESLWSVLNLISRSTRTTTLAHRAEILDDHMCDNNWKKMLKIVGVLKKKFTLAVETSEDTTRYFNGLSDSAGPALVAEWTEQIEAAEVERVNDPKVMDIMNTKVPKPRTRADIHLELAEKDSGGAVTTVAWLTSGLTLEEDQLNLEAFILRLGKYPTRAERLDVAGRRDRLRARIEKFQTDAIRMMDEEATETLTGDTNQIQLFELLEDIAGGPPTASDPPGTRPERMKLALPSEIPLVEMIRLGLEHLRDQELQLRRGQANDALQEIRLAIGRKSFQYTEVMRMADAKAVKTRSRSAIQDIGHEIAGRRRVYVKCLAAMEKLGMPAAEFESTYREIKNDHLDVSTAILDPNQRGISKKQLSWIWTVGQGMPELDPTEDDGPVRLTEFYRVHWLRARSQHYRWTEERRLTAHEMEWTTRFFIHKGTAWETLRAHSESIGELGGLAYANRQIEFWRNMARSAEAVFVLCNPGYRRLL